MVSDNTCQHIIPELVSDNTCQHIMLELVSDNTCHHIIPELVSDNTCQHFIPQLVSDNTCQHFIPQLVSDNTCQHFIPELVVVGRLRHHNDILQDWVLRRADEHRPVAVAGPGLLHVSRASLVVLRTRNHHAQDPGVPVPTQDAPLIRGRTPSEGVQCVRYSVLVRQGGLG